jgi:phytanoyl-CoA hydroxylase
MFQGGNRLEGDVYKVSDSDKKHFADHGYVHLRGFLTPEELAEIDSVYNRFLARDIVVPGKDYCDMSGDYGRNPDQFSIVNVMLPRRYYPKWQGNIFERRAASVAYQLCGEGMQLDYDQLLAKQPRKLDAVFAWHQDLAYWPTTPDPRTATLWLALDKSTVENGCMSFVPATNLEPHLRAHVPLFGDRGASHALGTDLLPQDIAVPVPIDRGDVTVHNERVMHGSGGNSTDGFRRAYVLAFRSEETVKLERQSGFTHSHNDERIVIEKVGYQIEAP